MPAHCWRASVPDLLRNIFVLALTLASLTPVRATAQQNYDAREVRLLPPYCKYTQLFRDRVPGGKDPAEIERWSALMGNTFIHMHHYCWGLMNGNRAMLFSRTDQDRTHNLYQSVKEFDYVIDKAPPDFAYLPEIVTKKGENLIKLGKGPEGVGELRRAIEIKPSYWPAYAAMSDYFKDNGDPKRAREWLEKGLAAVPNARALTRRLDELNAASNRSTRKKDPQPAAGR